MTRRLIERRAQIISINLRRATRLWLNLEANPDATARLAHQPSRPVVARAAADDERNRLWKRRADIDEGLDAYAASRSTATPVVVLEPR